MSASALPAETVLFTNDQLDSFVAAMISVDCKVNSQNAAVVEKATGFSEYTLRGILNHLVQEELIVRVDSQDAIKLINEGCP